MAYVFDGYSEASSTRNSPGDQSRPPAASRQRHRGQDGPPGGGGGGSEGVYYGTGRFYEENLRDEQQRRREREREHQYTPRYRSHGPFGGLNGPRPSTGGAWSEEEWGRLFMEALRRAYERSRRERGGLGMGIGSDAMGGGLGPPGSGAWEESRFEDLFGGGIFGSPGGVARGDGGGGVFGVGSGGSGGFGLFGGGSGGGGTSFEGVFGPPDNLPGRAEHDPGVGAGFGFGDREDVRRGGAGMTWAEFAELFRHRSEGGSSYGYAGGPPPADLFDSWHTDW